jgi:ArsR family transcriptional regulator, arsenate/arsenite/antimonite-responsive transcriptional repressor / arsenate reductase (thioredoxin)
MNIEGTLELQRRAGKHAALGDPSRLAIVDTLSLGDATPTELAAMLGMPSNLLAHHLNVLQVEGMLVRTRSEADRRRTYVRLVPGALGDVVPGRVATASRVVFVCTANSARSQLAAALWHKASAIPAASAGTHPAPRIDPGAVAAARRHQLPLRARRPRSFADVASIGDLVITVCDNAHEELSLHDNRAGGSGVHWSVPDPVRVGTDAAFDATFDDLTGRVADLAPRLTAC